jgi:endonuclease/exonuclease/phosphatase family metal-dependent hydrolase
MIELTIEFAGTSIRVINVHLATSAVEGGRQLQKQLDDFKTYPQAILLGDFNVRIGHRVLTQFLQDGYAVDALAGRTLDPPRTRWMVDWILVRGLDVTDAGIVHSPASDHSLVWAEISPPRANAND